MKKILVFLLLLISTFTIYLSNKTIEVVAASYDSYYATINTSSGQNLLSSLNKIITNGHKQVGYDGVKQAYKTTDINPETNKIWDMYSNEDYAFTTDMSMEFSYEGAGYNREHSVPQSWFDKAEPIRSDLFHVYPTDGYVNKRRGSYWYGETNSPTYTSKNGSKLGPSSHKLYGGTVFEPIDEYKGDFARTYFYMATRYCSQVGSWGNNFIGSYPYLNAYSIDLFMKWHLQDPVSEKETNRNDAVYLIQKNRNPYIDHPEFANFIWGDGSLDNPSVPTTYKVTYVASGAQFNYTDSTSYSKGDKIKEPTSIPTKTGETFIGWYKDSSYKTKWEFGVDTISSNITLYAKFEKNTPKTFEEVFVDLKIKSQLVFNVNEISGGAAVPTENTMTIDSFVSGTISGDEVELSGYCSYDTSLFTIKYKKNASSNAYIGSGQVRLYAANGNGNSIEINAATGVKIKNISYVDANSRTVSVTINNDGSSAVIQNKTNSESSKNNQIRLTSISITYETSGSGISYKIEEGSLQLNYVLQLSEVEYKLYQSSDKVLELKINNQVVNYSIVKLENEYRIICSINITDKNIAYKPEFIFNGMNICIEGYSAKSLANFYLKNLSSDSLVKQYGSCLNEIIG